MINPFYTFFIEASEHLLNHWIAGSRQVLALLGAGELWYRQGQEKHYLMLAFGFAEVQPDRVTILAETAERPEEIDLPRAQAAGALPPGDPERVAALLLALVHGASDLALSGHLARDGKGHASPTDLVDDLLAQLATA